MSGVSPDWPSPLGPPKNGELGKAGGASFGATPGGGAFAKFASSGVSTSFADLGKQGSPAPADSPKAPEAASEGGANGSARVKSGTPDADLLGAALEAHPVNAHGFVSADRIPCIRKQTFGMYKCMRFD